MKIKVSDLKKLSSIVLKHLEKNGEKEIELSSDYYWYIPKEQLYDLDNDPDELLMGQLYDDWENLNMILKREDEPLGYALVWLSSIFRFIGEKYAG
ncbi:MAG: hypothetical protein KAW12_18110 [Candidatus Aminicenantes bacterium]|nr:hypothetical protein [Candidatus Aminicenantes bacterium]